MTHNGTALIAGGAGFVGSHLCDRFLRSGHHVIAVDNLLTGSRRNIQHLEDRADFTFLEADVSEPMDIPGPVDWVLHFASPASPRDYVAYPIQTLKAGAWGTMNALDLARAKGAVFLLASTSEVYGDPEVSPQPETYWGHVNPVGPRSMYDEAKRFAEALTMAYRQEHGTDARVVRIFNTYGPRLKADDGRALSNFVSMALEGRPLTVYGDGSQTRSFCYVDDLVDGIYSLVTLQPRPGAADEPVIVNMGNPEEVTILELAREVVEILGSRSPIVFEPLPTDDPKLRRPDISRAKALLGWSPRVPRSEGIKRLAAHFSEPPDSWRHTP